MSSSVAFAATLRPADNPTGTVPGLLYKYYTVAGYQGALPDFSTLQPVKTGSVTNFTLDPRTVNEVFSFEFTGYVDIPAAGTWTFYTTSDDGSRLFIGSTLVVENNYAQGLTERSGSIALAAGKHAIKVQYAQGNGDFGFEVRFAGPAVAKQLMPDANLSYRPLVATPVISPADPRIPSSTFSMSITCATPSSTLYYTTNGQTPTTASSIYSAPVTLSVPANVQAIAVAAGLDNSIVAITNFVTSLPPGNDNFAAATVLAATLPTTATGTNLNATAELGEPNHADGSGFHSIWYAWTSSVSGSVQFSTDGSAFDTTLGVYTGSAVSALTRIGENDDALVGTKSSTVVISAVLGTTYYIAIDGFDGAQGNSVLNIAAGPVLSVVAQSLTATENPPSSAVFTITRTGSLANNLFLEFAFGGTADRGADYTRIDEFTTIPAGQSSVNVSVGIVDDLTADANETVSVTLTPSPLFAIDPIKAQATVTIVDNDVGSGTVKDPVCTPKRGFYSAPINVVLTSATAGAHFFYTMDGSVPTTTSGFEYFEPIQIAQTTTLRVIAFKAGSNPSLVETDTYIFTSDVVHQSLSHMPPFGWPNTWGSNVVDYGMDPDIVNNIQWSGTIENDLKTIPSMCVSMKLDDLFSGGNGIYANPYQDGYAWERPCSLELIDPNNAANTFSGLCGVRIRGGFSRSTSNPKHGFRIFFRKDYNKGSLSYPLFGAAGQQKIEKFDLRTFQNYSWSFQGDTGNACFIRDVFSRDTELALFGNTTRGEYYHLYINGQYWGLYNTEERPEASFAANYYGGDKDDYDVIKTSSDNGYNIDATDGNLEAWSRLWKQCKAGLSSNEAYFRIQGRNPDGSFNPNIENLLEVDQMIDYMLLIYYTGNLDAPISQFLGNGSPNNMFFFRSRTGSSGFRFFAHDSEHTLLDVNTSRIGPFSAGDQFEKSNPQWVFQQCMANAEFRLKVADHVRKHFFDGGALTTGQCLARFAARQAQLDRAVVGESARWGDAKLSVPADRNNWLNVCNNIVNNYLPYRTQIVLNQLIQAKLYTTLNAPSFSQYGGPISAGFVCTVSNPNATGQTYYTVDGSDPRSLGGVIASTAILGSANNTLVAMNGTTTLRARVLDGGTWSALTESTFTAPQDFSKLKVSELMYNPPDVGPVSGDEYEFLELKNTGSVALNVSGAQFTSGIAYTFPPGSILNPGQIIVLVSNPTKFSEKYASVVTYGTYTGRLPNDGGVITLKYNTGSTIFSFSYGDSAPWPVTPDGFNFSLVPKNPAAITQFGNPDSWRASTLPGGSPGIDDPINSLGHVMINEALTNTAGSEFIELFNPESFSVDVGGWYLTDDSHTPLKYRIPNATFIPAGGYLSIAESDYNSTPGVAPSFALDSHGEAVYLFSADNGTSALTGYSHGFAFGAAESEITFGRYVISDGATHFVAQSSNTPGAVNALPKVGPVVLNEVMYHPSAGADAYIELLNITNSAVNLFDATNPANTWKLAGVDFAFPPNAQLSANGLGVVCGIDPDLFRTKYNIPADVPVFGPWTGTLGQNGMHLELLKPGIPDGSVPYILVEALDYTDSAPWPQEPAGNGPSLVRFNSFAYGNDPANWKTSPSNFGSPGSKDLLVPVAPSSLAATPLSSTVLVLSWVDNSNTESGYTLQRSPNGVTDWTSLPSLGANIVSFQNSELTANTTYFFRVFATNAAGPSAFSNITSATTLPPPPPAPPAVLISSVVSQSEIDLSWNDGSDNETGFKIERSPDGVSNWTSFGTALANAQDFSAMNLDGGTTYYFRVKSFNVYGESTPTNVTTATTLPARIFVARVDAPMQRAGKGSVFVDFKSDGGEKTLAFALTFDATTLSNPVVAAGIDAPAGVTLTQTTAPGVLNFTLGWSGGQTFAAGTKQLLKIEFDVAANGAGTTTVFGLAAQNALPGCVDLTDTPLDARFRGVTAPLLPKPNHAPTITSTPFATVFPAVGNDPLNPGGVQNSARVGDNIVFSMTASDEDGDTLSYTWQFGDSSSGTTNSAQHVFLVPGVYNVEVSVNDGVVTTVSSLLFTVFAAVEVTPEPQPLPLTVRKALVELAFTARKPRDMYSITGTMAVTAKSSVQNVVATAKLGDTPAMVFTLNAAGHAKNGSSTFKMSKLRKGLFTSDVATFTVRVTKQTLVTDLSTAGLTDETTAKSGQSVSVPFLLTFGTQSYSTSLTMIYKAKQGKTGKAMTPR